MAFAMPAEADAPHPPIGLLTAAAAWD